MASEVGICNSALVKLGEPTITALDQGGKAASTCNALYDKLRDELLRRHQWNFAVARVKLARLSEAPAFGFDHQFELPADHLRTVAVFDNDAGIGAVRYRIEGGAILSDAEDIYLHHIRQVTDPNRMTADFREALSAMLAMEMAIPIADSRTLQQQMAELFRLKLTIAMSTDAVEDFPDEIPAGSWVAEREA